MVRALIRSAARGLCPIRSCHKPALMTRKLIDDCFRTDPRDAQRLTHDRTLEIIRNQIDVVVAGQTLPLAAALGRIAAKDITAGARVPGHTNSAVDGYAFAHESYAAKSGSRFTVGGRIAAGGAAISADAGHAVRVFTGAIVPEPFDTVAMQEDCEADAGSVFVPAGLKPGANVRQAGEDVGAGETVVRQGTVIRAPEIAALASLGVEAVDVFRQVRVGVIATGDEVRRGGELAHGQVYDVNTPLVSALLSASSAQVEDLGVWPDRREEVVRRLAAAREGFDLLITSGGASQGEEDHISHALQDLGSRHFWQIAVKPGRPLMLGQIGDTAAVGLPGNPVAVFVCCLMYVLPIVRQLSGAAWREPRRYPLPAAFTVANRKLGRREFWRGSMRQTPEGVVVDKFPRDGSGLISGLRAANGLIDVREDVPGVEVGQTVDFIPFSEFGILD
jgi:molybdopterin molybdotransferase